jgi:LacI family transcriptional regulator
LAPPLGGATARRTTPRLKTIAVSLPHDIRHGQELFQGILSYARPERPWMLRTVPPQYLPGILRARAVDGVIGLLWEADVVTRLNRGRVPAVDVSDFALRARTPGVSVDNVDVGRLAAEHLLERGHAHFAFYGPDTLGFVNGRFEGFVNRLAQAARTCHALRSGFFPPLRVRMFAQTPAPDPRLDHWLRELPKPVGLFAASDYWGLEVSQACESVGIRVPDEVAMVGVDDDHRFCECAWPTLSSVQLPSRRIGFEAAAMLDRVMSGERLPRTVVRLPSPGIVVRRSSDVRATGDELAAEAARFISEHAADDIGAVDVAAAASASRRSLELRFRKAFGRSLGQEITRVRIDLAKRLLADTDFKMPAIAARAGFPDGNRLAVMFRRHTGMTPTTYRRQSRIG